MKSLLTFILVALCLTLSAQADIEMADDFRGEGKIYVVVAVVTVILIGIFIQLFRLERKVKILEKEKD